MCVSTIQSLSHEKMIKIKTQNGDGFETFYSRKLNLEAVVSKKSCLFPVTLP